jgi:hypothetical protein
MRIFQGLLLASGVFAQAQPDRILFINDGSVESVQCFSDASKISSPVSVSVTQCPQRGNKKEQCPPANSVNIDEAGIVTFDNWKSQHSDTLITCKHGSTSQLTGIGVLKADLNENPVSSESPPDLSNEKDPNSNEPKEFLNAAVCDSGYTNPVADVIWKNEAGDELDVCEGRFEDQCVDDTSQDGVSQTREMPLNFVLEPGQKDAFTCEITYWVAVDGEKVERKKSYRYPKEGHIGYGDVEEEPVAAATDAPVTKPFDARALTVLPEEETTATPEEESGSLNNALLGTATGIIILAIIIVLIWFIRKKQNQGNEGYEQGNEQGKAEIAQQESA